VEQVSSSSSTSSSSHGFQIPWFHFFLERSFSLGTGEERHAVVAAPFKKNMYPVLFFTIVLSSMHSTCSLAGTHLLCGKWLGWGCWSFTWCHSGSLAIICRLEWLRVCGFNIPLCFVSLSFFLGLDALCAFCGTALYFGTLAKTDSFCSSF
jgi:hypothetical protein